MKKLSVLMMVLVFLLNGFCYGAEVYDSSLVLHLEFDSKASDTAYELRNDAKIVENTERGSVLKLDGLGDYLDCGDKPEFSIREVITLSVWIKASTLPDEMAPIISKGPQTWRISLDGDTGRLTFYCNNIRPTEHLVGDIKVDDNRWHHVAATYNGSRMYLYVDGSQDVAASSSGDWEKHPEDNVWIGGDVRDDDEGWGEFAGLVDDVAIFKRELSTDEITRLYNDELAFFIAGPELKEFRKTVAKAEKLVRNEDQQKAISFLENKIEEYESFKQNNPNVPVLKRKRIVPDLYYLLAEVKLKAGASENEIMQLYKNALESDSYSMLSVPRQAWSLLWMYHNIEGQEYQDIIQELIKKDTGVLKSTAAKARFMYKESKYEEIIDFLNANLSAYLDWQKKYPSYDTVAEKSLPAVYFQLAQAAQAADVDKEQITEAYKKTLVTRSQGYVPQRTAALIWFIESRPVPECTRTIEAFINCTDSKKMPENILLELYRRFESEDDWKSFSKLLTSLFDVSENTGELVVFIQSHLSNRNWVEKFTKYINEREDLKFNRDKFIADNYFSGSGYTKAAGLYEDLVTRCKDRQQKASLQLRLCTSLFQAGRYSQVSSRLSELISNPGSAGGSLPAEALLLKGRADIRLGKTEQAISSFFKLMMEYPETKDMPRVNYFLGYSYMLRRNYDCATEAFKCLLKDYPDSDYADRARMYIERIKIVR